MRGLAAVLVLFDHTHQLFLEDITRNPSAHGVALGFVYALSSAGPEAVAIFFVLSGFLVSGSMLRWLANGQWSWRRYLTHRLVRLWLVLLPGLLLCAFWDNARLLLLHAHVAHGAGFAAARPPGDGLGWKTLLGNVFFLQDIRFDTFGSDRVLWSLAFEFWYYILFPCAVLALHRRSSPLARVLYALAFLAVAAFAGRAILALFPVWLLGTAIHWLKPPRASSFLRWTGLLLYLPAVGYIVSHPWNSHFFKLDYLVGLFTAALIWLALSARGPANPRSLLTRVSRRLAGFSYSLYVVHYPLLAFAAALLVRGASPWKPDPEHLLFCALLICIAIAYGWLIASLTEFHNDAVRDWAERRIVPPGSVSAHNRNARNAITPNG